MRSFLWILALISALNLIPLVNPMVACLTQRPADDAVVLSEARLNPLKQAIPARSVVGYLADGEVTKGGLIRLDACRRFYMTQYALAPIIVMHDTDREVIVGNFSSPQAAQSTAQAHNLQIMRDFGNGIMLLRKKEASYHD